MLRRAHVPHITLWVGFGLAIAGLALWSCALALTVAGTVLFVGSGLLLRGDQS